MGRQRFADSGAGGNGKPGSRTHERRTMLNHFQNYLARSGSRIPERACQAGRGVDNRSVVGIGLRGVARSGVSPSVADSSRVLSLKTSRVDFKLRSSCDRDPIR